MAVSPATQHIRTALQLLAPNHVVEIRALGVAGRGNRVDSGYFDNAEQAALAVARIDGKADGIYVTLNPCQPALLARAANRIKEYAKTTTSDPDIERRTWFLIDADPVRPKDISSTDAEHEAAHARALAIREWLTVQGWPQPVLADSGNGYHLLYSLDLPNNQESADLLKACLEALAFQFDDDAITIDRKVFNAARIGKLYGTMACKGDNTAERPHRRSAVREAPPSPVVVDAGLLKALARRVPQAQKPEHYAPASGGVSPSNIEAWLQSYHLDYKEKAWGNDTIYQLAECPFDSGHGRDSYVVQRADGALGFGCFHNGCSGNHWREFRSKLEPGHDKKKEPTFKHGVACCPTHGTPLIKTKAGDAWRCADVLKCFWWKGEGYTPPVAKVAEVIDRTTGEIKAAPTEYVSDWTRGGVTLRELQQIVFPPRVWIVDSIMTTGATLLAGKAKAKKSWLALNIALGVASGGKAMGQMDVAKGRVLYLDLESNQQRMQERVQATLGSKPWPETFHLFTDWPNGEEGIQRIDHWMAAFPDTVLVVVDIFQNIRPPRQKNGNLYEEDYEAIKALNKLADRHRIAVLVLHHTTKAKADDVFQEISGSMGLQGGAATMWVLAPVAGEMNASTLNIKGRDIINDDPISLEWDAYLCQHTITGSAAQYAVSHERRLVLEAMADGRDYTAKELAATVGKSINAITKILIALAGANAIEKTGHGRYAIVPQTDKIRESNKPRILPPGNYSMDCVQQGDRVLWRVWDDASEKVVAECNTEDEALALIPRQ